MHLKKAKTKVYQDFQTKWKKMLYNKQAVIFHLSDVLLNETEIIL